MASGAHADLEKRQGRRASASVPGGQEEAVFAGLTKEKRAAVKAAMGTPNSGSGRPRSTRGGLSLPELTSPNRDLHERVSPPQKGASPYKRGTAGLLAAVKSIKATRKVTKKLKDHDPMDLARPKRKPKPALEPMIQMNRPREEMTRFLQMRGLRKEECEEYIDKAVLKWNSLHPKSPYDPAPSPYMAHKGQASEGKPGEATARSKSVAEEPTAASHEKESRRLARNLDKHALRKKVLDYNKRFDRRKEKRRTKADPPAAEAGEAKQFGRTQAKLEGQMRTLEALEKDLEKQRAVIAMELECREKATLKLQANSRGMLGRVRVRKKKEVTLCSLIPQP